MRHRLISYKSITGDVECVWFSEDDQIPDRMAIGGVQYVREIGRRAGDGLQLVMDSKPVVSNSSPRWHGVKAGRGRGFYDTYTKEGKPVISSRAALREAQARAAWHGENIQRMGEYDV